MREIIQIYSKDYPQGKKVFHQYTSKYYYQVRLNTTSAGWRIDLKLQKFAIPFVKKLETDIFSDYKEDLQVYVAKEQGKEAALIAFNHQAWNNCTRVWDLYVEDLFQRNGIGSQLLAIAHQKATQWGSRALVLETQSCNVKAINFYRKHQFNLVGLDLLSYSNEDVVNKEVRLEMRKNLNNVC